MNFRKTAKQTDGCMMDGNVGQKWVTKYGGWTYVNWTEVGNKLCLQHFNCRGIIRIYMYVLVRSGISMQAL